MEPLVDKLARQKVVKQFFAGIRACDKQFDKLKRLKRFFAVTICATIAIIAFTLATFHWDNPSILSTILAMAWKIVAWPIVVASYLLPGRDDVGDGILIIYWVAAGSVAAGLFWASLIELFFILKKRHASRSS